MTISTQYYYRNLELGHLLKFRELMAECREMYGKNVNPEDYYELTYYEIQEGR